MYGDYTLYSLPTWVLGLPRVLSHKLWKSECIGFYSFLLEMDAWSLSSLLAKTLREIMYGDYTPYSLPTWALGLPRVLPHKPWKSECISFYSFLLEMDAWSFSSATWKIG
jgi:hypothetical protein